MNISTVNMQKLSFGKWSDDKETQSQLEAYRARASQRKKSIVPDLLQKIEDDPATVKIEYSSGIKRGSKDRIVPAHVYTTKFIISGMIDDKHVECEVEDKHETLIPLKAGVPGALYKVFGKEIPTEVMKKKVKEDKEDAEILSKILKKAELTFN